MDLMLHSVVYARTHTHIHMCTIYHNSDCRSRAQVMSIQNIVQQTLTTLKAKDGGKHEKWYHRWLEEHESVTFQLTMWFYVCQLCTCTLKTCDGKSQKIVVSVTSTDTRLDTYRYYSQSLHD